MEGKWLARITSRRLKLHSDLAAAIIDGDYFLLPGRDLFFIFGIRRPGLLDGDVYLVFFRLLVQNLGVVIVGGLSGALRRVCSLPVQ